MVKSARTNFLDKLNSCSKTSVYIRTHTLIQTYIIIYLFMPALSALDGFNEKHENQECTLARYVHKLRILNNISSIEITYKSPKLN